MSRSRLPKTSSKLQTPVRSTPQLFPVKVYLADGQTLSQTHPAGIHSGESTGGDTSGHTSDQEHNSADENNVEAQSDTLHQGGFINLYDHQFDPSSPHRQKRRSQSDHWLAEVIPSLINLYMELLHHTKNLSLEPPFREYKCTCGLSGRNLDIILVRFASLEQTHIHTCNCMSAARQLLDHGCFPCAPLAPTLAVDMQVLEFVSKLFLIHSDDKGHVNNMLAKTRYNLLTPPTEPSMGSDSEDDSSSEKDSSDELNRKGGSSKCRHLNIPTPQLDRPSEYLRSQCPLCFGGDFSQVDDNLGFDAIVCVDACFTQKHNRQGRDPPMKYPASVFIPEEDVLEMEARVEEICPPRRKSKTQASGSVSEAQDGFKGSLKVPSSVLNGCEASFTAADECREKASTQFFDSTALMGLLCCHDRVLWLVNMTSAGEQQHYVLILLETLFKHLPEWFTIGLLYDIACQLHYSCHKWGFLKLYLPQISFAISVFHAFGHRWPCQLVYHPQKCIGFGLSDGERCECFWHAISKLIPYLRVCGFHAHLYTVDNQVWQIDWDNLIGLGRWLEQKWQSCYSRRKLAEEDIRKSGQNEMFLCKQWELQVAHQTKPLPAQSKDSGNKAVKRVIQLREGVQALVASVSKLEKSMLDTELSDYHLVDIRNELESKKATLAEARKQLQTLEAALGIQER
uniref:CxC1-like cysteine cluster associated with KDZ transposases domain-containing protein n=1 Tax=Moniliophthora roreri TaxID=221103 RepID=A0A0W0F829_MONRR